MDYKARPLVLTSIFSAYPTGTKAEFFGNLGTGAIDYDTAITTRLGVAGVTTISGPYNAPTASADWSFGFETFDEPGNESGSPVTVSSFIDCEPQPQAAMTEPSYAFATETLVLTL